MNNISTIILLIELRNRLDEQLHGEAASTDPVVGTLLSDNPILFDQLDSLHSTLKTLIDRYYRITAEGLNDNGIR